MYTAENAPGVAVLLSGDADVPGPLTGLPTHQDNLDTVIGRYSRLIVVGADADLGAVLTRLLRTDRLDVEVGYVPRRRSPATRAYRLPAGRRAAASPAVTDQQPAGPASPARAAGTTHAARGSGIPVAAEATAATLGKAPSELVGEPTFPAVATEAAGSAGASDAAIATGAAGPAVTDQSRTVAGPTVLTGGTRPTVPAIAIQQSTRPTGLARPAVSAVADQRPANNAWVGALTALSTSCANVALAVSAAAYHPPPEVRAATNCARYAAACALICWYSCAFAPNSAAIAIDTSSAAVGRQRRRRACHERIGRADRRTDPRHICGGRGQKEGCAITNDM